ncbi:MAG: GTPase HflX, partial [Planctomycetota bacterium]|nr:GTPase HflX [Planctomycetota bacterium]
MPPSKERTTIDVKAERAVLAAVRLPDSRYDPADPFGELTALTEQAGARVVGELEQRLERPVAGTYIGSGKLRELAELAERLDASVIIFDHDLSPRQISNIEKVTNRKVLDRSELILDIFATRATTHAAKIQVEIAQLEYTLPRLRAMWGHLERLAGGSAGGVGTRGPGEQQLEIDRRLVQKRKQVLQSELATIQARKRREVRARKNDHFTVGLVGYTNAGKSTLFNALTAGGAYADDRLFATLMTRTREWDLGGGLRVMLSDTVGFVRDLPHHLIASFRATLEEATHADLLLVVVDLADPAAEMHLETVLRTLDEVFEEVARVEKRLGERAGGGGDASDPRRVVLLNKVDRLKDNAELLVWQHNHPDAIAISALPGEEEGLLLGGAALAALVRDAVQGQIRELEITVPLADAKTIHTIENRAEVLDRRYNDDRTVTLTTRIGQRQLDQLRSAGAKMAIVGE